MMDTMIGVDLAKNVFQLHGASMMGELRFRKKLSRAQFRKIMADHLPATVVMEASGSAHYWAREMIGLGHAVKLIAPQYVRPFVKRQKNDAADAEAIVIAAQRPEMRFVEPKSEEQQAMAVLFRARERLVHQRTDLVNAIRSICYEYGHVIPVGIHQVNRIAAILDEPSCDLPGLVQDECRDILAEIAAKTAQIDAKTRKARELMASADGAKQLQTMPGVGPMVALAITAFVADIKSFRRGRDFAAWLGLVPRQHSSGGKVRLGRISKAGQNDIRRLLIIGAMSRLNWMGRQSIPEGSWLSRLRTRWPARSGPCLRKGKAIGIRRWLRLRDRLIARNSQSPVKGGVRSRRPEWANDRNDPDRENQQMDRSLKARAQDFGPAPQITIPASGNERPHIQA